MYRSVVKRLIDFILALILVVVLSPVILVVTLLLLFVNKGHPFFFQDRPGHREKNIRIVKFKSMNDKKDNRGYLLPDNVRLTPVGQFIRKTSLDEIPQLFNVLMGDMSLVGPRPLLHKYLPLYSTEQRRRHEVRPGITGWAQINGRNSISWKEKFELDIYYIENQSFGLDVKILYRTIRKIIIREGINQSNDRPMMPFDGTN